MHIKSYLDAPLTGHGFDVYREGARHVTWFMGLPISASAEKVFIFRAVLEEVGAPSAGCCSMGS